MSALVAASLQPSIGAVPEVQVWWQRIGSPILVAFLQGK